MKTRFINAFKVSGDGWVLQEEKGTACLWKKVFGPEHRYKTGFVVTQSEIKYFPGVDERIFGLLASRPKFLVQRRMPSDWDITICDNYAGAWETWNILCEADTKCEGY